MGTWRDQTRARLGLLEWWWFGRWTYGVLLAYRKVRNQYRKEIRAHQKSIQTRVLMVARQNKPLLFKYMRRCKKNKPSALLLKLDEIPTAEAILVANGFRDHFVSVYTDSFDGPHPVFSPRQYDTALCQVTYGVADVEKFLKQVDPYSAMGPDYIHPRILKEAADTMALTPFSLFSDSLSTGVLPAAWKEAHVTLIYKSGDRHSPARYRLISLTSIPCKILERLIKKAILTHLQMNELISDSQHGFLPGRSCTTNLLLYIDSLTPARDDGVILDTIFFDFARVFDKVPHKALLHKLQAYGVCGELLQWIDSFLTDRSFCVKVGQTLSSPRSCLLRCPSRLRSRNTSLSGLHKRPSGCHLKSFSSIRWWPRNSEVSRSKRASRGYNQCKELINLVYPLHQRRQVRSYVPWRHLGKSIYHPRWHRGKWHPYTRPQERCGYLDWSKGAFHESAVMTSSNFTLLTSDPSVVHTGLQTNILCLDRVQRTATRLVRGIQNVSLQWNIAAS